MSVYCSVVIARGYRFTEDMFEDQSEMEEVLEEFVDDVIMVSPMTSLDFIFGQQFFSSKGDIEEDGGFDVQLDTLLEEYGKENEIRSDFSNFDMMPSILRSIMIKEGINPHTHIFTLFD